MASGWPFPSPVRCDADSGSTSSRPVQPVSNQRPQLPTIPTTLSPVDRVLTATVCGFLGGVTKVIMTVLNSTNMYHREKLLWALGDRPKGQGVVTVCNHVSAVDDPGAIAAMLPVRWFLIPEKMRWTMCATDRCFKNPVTGAILRKGKVLPIERGKGLYQPYMDDIVSRVNNGEWVHMFPEGTRSRDGSIGKMKLGVARLVLEPAVTPRVVPFYHSGMENILRRGQWVPLNFGQQLAVIVGDPIDMSDLVEEYRRGETPDRELHFKVAHRIGEALVALKAQLRAAEVAKKRIA